jgi:hypothetical protein
MEQRYEAITSKNIYYKTSCRITDDVFVGAYATGDWYLQPSFRRLVQRMKALLQDTICIYESLSMPLVEWTPSETDVEKMEHVATIIASCEIAPILTYRGLVCTSMGIGLAGYSDDEELVLKLRQALQSQETTFVAPLFRWVKQPTTLQLLRLEDEVKRWSECVFGEIRIRQWILRKGTEDYFAVPVHQHICHRGNLAGPQKQLENNFGILIQRSIQGLDVEIDVWYHEGSLWLGHDKPEYKITLDWLASCKRRLIHCKDGKTLEYLTLESGRKALDLHLFYHTNEHYAITSKGHLLVCPGQPLLQGSLCMMPELANYTEEEKLKCFSICSDSRHPPP